MNTINGKDVSNVSKSEALEYCYKMKKIFVSDCDQREFDCLIGILESGTISVSELPDYGMCDQDF